MMEIKDFKQARKALAKLAGLKIYLKEVENDLAQEIKTCTDKAERRNRNLAEVCKALEVDLEQFAAAHKEEICEGGKRSWESPEGTLGWRASESLQPKEGFSMEMVLAALKKREHFAAIKTEESVIKGALKNWKDKDLNRVGLEIVQTEKFFIKIRETNL
jgi:phage host-nuclease inhibitor protein Gam